MGRYGYECLGLCFAPLLHVLAGLGFVVGDDKALHEWTVGVGMEWWYVDIVQEKTRAGEIRLATCDGRRE
jgi:hypothetical protein